MIVVGIIFVFMNINNIYHLIFGGWDQGVVFFKYSIHGNEYTFMKRSVKRSIFIQIMLFSMNGIYTLFKDRKQELMIFATGNIYRETGTASKEVEQKSFVRKIKSEKKSLSKKIELESVGIVRLFQTPITLSFDFKFYIIRKTVTPKCMPHPSFTSETPA